MPILTLRIHSYPLDSSLYTLRCLKEPMPTEWKSRSSSCGYQCGRVHACASVGLCQSSLRLPVLKLGECSNTTPCSNTGWCLSIRLPTGMGTCNQASHPASMRPQRQAAAHSCCYVGWAQGLHRRFTRAGAAGAQRRPGFCIA